MHKEKRSGKIHIPVYFITQRAGFFGGNVWGFDFAAQKEIVPLSKTLEFREMFQNIIKTTQENLNDYFELSNVFIIFSKVRDGI